MSLFWRYFQSKPKEEKKIKKMEVNKRRVLKFDPCSISDSETRFEIQIVQELNNLKEEFTKTSEEKEIVKSKFLKLQIQMVKFSENMEEIFQN